MPCHVVEMSLTQCDSFKKNFKLTVFFSEEPHFNWCVLCQHIYGNKLCSTIYVFRSLKCLNVVYTQMFYLTGDCLYCFFSNDPRWRLVSAQIGLHIEYRQEMADAASKDGRFLVLEECDDVENGRNASVRCKDKTQYFYPQILQVLCVVVTIL